MTEEHVPLLFYSPRYIRPERREGVVSQIDVLPTLAGLAGIPYTNTTLGRDVYQGKGPNLAFTIMHDEGRIGLITDAYYFRKNLHFQKEELHPLKPGLHFTPRQADSIKARMSTLATAYYETARWMLVHNKK
jgi:phosphoglycerol transferase MdoB-like AlkP superfamily enzyme